MPSKRTLCCSVKTGTLVIAILEIIGSAVFLILHSIFLTSEGQKDAFLVGVSVFVVGVIILNLGFSALLISALHENKPRRCMPWLILQVIFMALYLFMFFRTFAFMSLHQDSLFFVTLLAEGFGIGVQCYFLSIVQRFMNSALANSVV